MDNRQISFITCVNDERKYAECRYYLDRLYVPEGYSVDVISVREAPSMAAGYNAGMKNSDAKYKVYLHQDVFIHHVDFITDLLEIFRRNEEIGLLGMIGNKEKSDVVPCRWETGKVADCYGIHDNGFFSKETFREVYAVDGLLLATQYDLSWREELFDGWHFYDLSQCMEFGKAGYKTAVPWQEEAWCYHDTMYPDLRSYWRYYERFVHEYAGLPGFPFAEQTADMQEYKLYSEHAQTETQLWEKLEECFEMGEKEQLRIFFSDPAVRRQIGRKEYQLIVCIDQLEEQEGSLLRFWIPGMTFGQLLSRLQELKYMLKRMEWGAEDGQEAKRIQENYSEYALMLACGFYAVHKGKLNKSLRAYLMDKADAGMRLTKS